MNAPNDAPGDTALEARNRTQTRLWIVLLAVLCAGPVYMAVMMGVRAHVTRQIVKNESRALPSFDLATLTGSRVTTESLRGRWVVLHFFRSQCVSCDAEAPEFKRFVASVDPDRVRVVGVLLDQVMGYDDGQTQRTLQRLGYEHEILVADRAFVDAFHGAGWSHVTPVTYVADAEGTIQRALRGYQSREALIAALSPELRPGG